MYLELVETSVWVGKEVGGALLALLLGQNTGVSELVDGWSLVFGREVEGSSPYGGKLVGLFPQVGVEGVGCDSYQDKRGDVE